MLLRSIREAKNVNALVDAQVLTFAAAGLTVVYGDNASGKSGYARLVKAVAGARHREPVHTNVFSDGRGQDQKAEIELVAGGVGKKSGWPDGVSEELRAIRFYDEACGDAYIGGDSEMTYRPAALTLLDGLIAVCDAVRDVLDGELHQNQLGRAALPVVAEGTSAASFVRTLSGTTTDAAIEAACALPNDVEAELGRLLQEEARLQASDPSKERTRLERLAAAAEAVSGQVGRLDAALSDGQVRGVAGLRERAVELRAAATIASSRTFEAEPLTGVGSATWRALWEAAREFSEREAYVERAFPVVSDDARCMFCQQELSAEAADRLGRFHAFMQDTAAQQADEAERAFQRASGEYRSLETTPSQVTASLVELQGADADLGQGVAAWLEQAAARRSALSERLGGSSGVALPSLPESPQSVLDARAGELRARARGIDATQFREVLGQVVGRKNELQARMTLAQHRAAVVAEVKRLAERDRIEAAKRLTDTAHVTRKTTELTEEHVTALVRDRFTRESDAFAWSGSSSGRLAGRKGSCVTVRRCSGPRRRGRSRRF